LIDRLLDALILQEPFSKLPVVFYFVFFVVRPRHVEDERLHGTCDNVLHKAFAPVKGVPAGKVVLGATQDFDAQTVHAGVFLQQGNEWHLVTVRGQNEVAGH